MGLGSIWPGKPTLCVFIKAPPEEVEPILAANRELCPIDLYATKYHLPVSKIIPRTIVEGLVRDGVISMEMAGMHKQHSPNDVPVKGKKKW